MNVEKNSQYYIKMFFLSFIGASVYTIYLAIQAKELTSDILFNIILIPIVFTFFLFVFEISAKKLLKPIDKKVNYQAFLLDVSKNLKKDGKLEIEDFRKLRENQSFQKSIQQAYDNVEKGIIDNNSIARLQKKFNKGSIEYIATVKLIEEVNNYLSRGRKHKKR